MQWNLTENCPIMDLYLYGMSFLCISFPLFRNSEIAKPAKSSTYKSECSFLNSTVNKVNSRFHVKLLLIHFDFFFIIEYYTLIQQTFLFLSYSVVHNI